MLNICKHLMGWRKVVHAMGTAAEQSEVSGQTTEDRGSTETMRDGGSKISTMVGVLSIVPAGKWCSNRK